MSIIMKAELIRSDNESGFGCDNLSWNEYDNKSWNEGWNRYHTYMINLNVMKAKINLYANESRVEYVSLWKSKWT